MPSLDAIADDPAQAAVLPPATARALLARCVVVQNALLTPALAADGSPREVLDEDAAVGMEEAARILDMKLSTLYRKWRALGIGYRDADGRVKFTRAALRRYLARKGG